MGQVVYELGLAFGYDLGRSSACRLACLCVPPFRQFRRTRVSSPINTARVSLSWNERHTVTFITLYV